MEQKNAWESYDEKKMKEVFAFSDQYKEFISTCKSERECINETIRIAEANGYIDLDQVISENRVLKAGDKVYANNMGKTIALFLIGEQPIEKGMKILGAHVDSPRLDIKQNPLYEEEELAMFETHYYGGIKKYQWVTMPLAIHGIVVKKDGTKIHIEIGEDENDPVVGISDLLVHLAGDQLGKTGAKVIEGEDLNILVGSIPLVNKDKEKAKATILKLLKERYNMDEEDFLSAELEAVPAGKARDYGLDRSMIIGYGQDDRVCAYTSLAAMMEIKQSDKTCVCLLVDKEEVGSIGATGMQSKFFENCVAEVMNCTQDYSEIKLRRALKNSKMLSSDVSAAFDPNYASVMEKKNSAYFGHGIVFNKYTGSRGKSGCNDANAEYLGELRNIMEKEKVIFQTAELGKVDQGGGGTIAYILAQYNMEVIDCGVAVQNMHAPWEVVSKADVYETKCGY
ncbi:MAG: aminopeptidase, partial [Erysipelotrichaceae bacterium]